MECIKGKSCLAHGLLQLSIGNVDNVCKLCFGGGTGLFWTLQVEIYLWTPDFLSAFSLFDRMPSSSVTDHLQLKDVVKMNFDK